MAAPLIGRNTTVSYEGREYHVQTEDSVLPRPQVVTHLFGDTGRILATRRTPYTDHIESPSGPELVKRLILAQHRRMLDDLAAGRYRSSEGDAPDRLREECPLDLGPLLQEAASMEARRAASRPTPGGDTKKDAAPGRPAGGRGRPGLSDALVADDPTTGDLDELMIRQVQEFLARTR